MDIAEAKQQIRDTVDAYLTQDETGAYLIPVNCQRPLFLVGAPGIGKTAVVSQVAHELGIGLVSYSMTHHTRQSALGLPFIVHRTFDGQEYDVSEYTMSEIIASVYEYQEKTGLQQGILFLDEINCVSETLYPSMLQFLQAKTFGRHRVPDGWIVVCAGNPPEYNKSVYEFDIVTLDRLRKIDVEPNLEAWLDYARAQKVHPAILSYLQTRETDFYSVESTPEGKRFVTARAWVDLSRVVKLYEMKGITVNRTLIQQFLQNDAIADRFAQYYALFSKYRSDYQIADILAGRAPEAIANRARMARLDERLALVRLIIDALDTRLSHALEVDARVSLMRDTLRRLKPAILDGQDASALLAEESRRMADDAQESVAAETATDDDVRPQRLAAVRLSDIGGACAQERTLAGPEAFATVKGLYREDVQNLRETVEGAKDDIAHAFAFLDATFGDDREVAVFVAELAAHASSSRFIAQFGSDAYFAHNKAARVRTNRKGLLTRVADFDLEAAKTAADQRERERKGACACEGCH